MKLVVVLWVLISLCYADPDLYRSTFTRKHLTELRLKTKELFNHAWGSYMDHGFPLDEVRPLTCVPLTRDPKDAANVVKNDVMGNFSVTVFDNLDSFLIMGESDKFEQLIYWIKDNYPNFDIDSNVQVFETNIRVLGGLLSAHLYASDKRKGFAIPGYDGFLLKLAHDLGSRLLLAFNNKHLIPYPRTNLRYGPLLTPKQIQLETCTSGAGSPVLEFTLLSRLTGDSKFEKMSKRLFLTLWNSRTDLNLLPMSIDVQGGKWLDYITGIGASVDSFYEYALKFSILFDDNEFFDIWQSGYLSLNTHLKSDFIYENVDTRNGQVLTNWLDALSAFWPGLQVLAGDITNAIKFHSVFLKIWETFDSIPERWNYEFMTEEFAQLIKDLPLEKKREVIVQRVVALEWYPLRPEFIESTYHLYRATHDPIYLQIGQDFLRKMNTKFKAPCGFAGVLDARSNTRQDRMESFVLSETLKYLYLLFDEDNAVHKPQGNLIFSTEAHPLWFDQSLQPNVTGFDWFAEDKLDFEFSTDDYKLGEYTMFKFLDDIVPTFLKNIWQWITGEESESESEFATKVAEDSFDEIIKNLSVKEKLKVSEILSNLIDNDELSQDQMAMEATKIFSTILSKFNTDLSLDHASNLQMLRNVQDRISSNYRPQLPRYVFNDTVPEIPKLDTLNLTAVANYGLDICIVPSMYQVRKDQFLTSLLLSDPRFYHVDYRYLNSFVQPNYISEKSFDKGGNSVELSYDFYQLHTSHLLRQPMSDRYPTAMVFDGYFDPREAIRDNHVIQLVSDDSKGNDFYITDLTGSKLRLEKLEVGDIDHFNHEVTEQDLSVYNGDYVFRILKINGVEIPQELTIWMNTLNELHDTTYNVKDQKNACMIIDDVTVINFKKWITH